MVGVNFDEDENDEIKIISKPINRETLQKKEIKDKKPVSIKKKEVLTEKDVYEYIIKQSGKWSGFATLKSVIERHKAISVSVLSAIISIHREFVKRL